MATASGVNALLVPTAAGAAMTQVHALSPDGRCKAFGAEADGYGRGEGYVATVLEPHNASGAPALALVAGSAVNQDGRSSSLTAPHGPSQQALIQAAMRDAGLVALEYVASHGTGASCWVSLSLLRGRQGPAQSCATWLLSWLLPRAALQARRWGTPSSRGPCARQWPQLAQLGLPLLPWAPTRR